MPVGTAFDTSRAALPAVAVQAFLTAMVFCFFCASAVLGNDTVRTPFFTLASILSASTPSGTRNVRWKEPKRHLEGVVLLGHVGACGGVPQQQR
jgi:hypothetical protein